MNNIALNLEVSGDLKQIIIRAKTASAGDSEDRTYSLDPYSAVEFANTMLHMAEACGVEIQMETKGISNEKRNRLILRTTHVMRSLGNRKPLVVASQVVDTILSEVL